MRLRDTPTVEVTGTLPCSPEQAWALVTDIELPTGAEGELQRVEWLDGATGSRSEPNSADTTTVRRWVNGTPNRRSPKSRTGVVGYGVWAPPRHRSPSGVSRSIPRRTAPSSGSGPRSVPVARPSPISSSSTPTGRRDRHLPTGCLARRHGRQRGAARTTRCSAHTG